MSPKNVILITIDSLRCDHLSCLGYHKNTTPNLDQMADEGVLFTNAISCGPDTPSSIAPLLTSTYVLQPLVTHGGIDKLKKLIADEPNKIKSRLKEFEMIGAMTFEIYNDKTTIHKILKNNGFNTAAFHSNPFLSRYSNLGKSFDYFYDSFSNLGGTRKHKIRLRKFLENNIKLFTFIKNLYNKVRSDNTPYDRAETINKKAITWLENYNSNFFVWIHYMDVHFPYKPLKKFQNIFRSQSINNLEMSKLNYKMTHQPEEMSEHEIKDIIDLYDAEIRYVDHAIRSLINELDDMNILDETLIIITADHGDEFRDHGDFIHNAKLYDELIKVPLIIYNSAYKNIKFEDTISLLDISPTILDFFDIPIPKTFQGNSIIPLLDGGRKSSGVISESLGKGKLNISYRTHDWKFILNDITGKNELYNLRKDPEEKINLIDIEKERGREFELKIREHISKHEKNVGKLQNGKERTKMKIRKLKSYGKL